LWITVLLINYFRGLDISLVPSCQEVRINKDRGHQIFVLPGLIRLPESLEYFHVTSRILSESELKQQLIKLLGRCIDRNDLRGQILCELYSSDLSAPLRY